MSAKSRARQDMNAKERYDRENEARRFAEKNPAVSFVGSEVINPYFFSAIQEAEKMYNMCFNNPNPNGGPTRMSSSVIDSLPYKDDDAGFFVTLFHTKETSSGQRGLCINEDYVNNNGFAAASKFVNELGKRFKTGIYKKDYFLATAYCSWDMAKKHYYEMHNLCTAFIGFSTPTQLFLLAEDPDKKTMVNVKEYA